jgi:hypothetical protein
MARKAAREGDKIRRRAIEHAMLAGWYGEDADELNWLDEALRALPGPEAAAYDLYGLVSRLVGRLAEATGEERELVLKKVLQRRISEVPSGLPVCREPRCDLV